VPGLAVPIRSIILSVDEWQDGVDAGATIDAPDEETVREAVLALDGRRHVSCALHVMGKEETCYLVVTRRADGHALAATLDGELHHDAAGVTVEVAVRAALYFLDFGRLDPATPWQLQAE
jgi:hypothetical protein